MVCEHSGSRTGRQGAMARVAGEGSPVGRTREAYGVRQSSAAFVSRAGSPFWSVGRPWVEPGTRRGDAVGRQTYPCAATWRRAESGSAAT